MTVSVDALDRFVHFACAVQLRMTSHAFPHCWIAGKHFKVTPDPLDSALRRVMYDM